MKNNISGFTLIELIIGITILSLLSVALLAALDPVEQFNKARDTATRNTAMEIHNAIIRYNAATEYLPTLVPSIGNPTAALTSIQILVTAGELKSNFKNSAESSLKQIAIFNGDGTAGGVMTCYRPMSKQFSGQKNMYVVTPAQSEAFLYPTNYPVLVTTCSASQKTGDGCLWCAE